MKYEVCSIGRRLTAVGERPRQAGDVVARSRRFVWIKVGLTGMSAQNRLLGILARGYDDWSAVTVN